MNSFSKVVVSLVFCLSFSSLIAFVISGNIAQADGSQLSAVDVRISNIAGDPLQTDINGNFSIDLAYTGKPHMVSPRKTGYTFEPAYFYVDQLYGLISEVDYEIMDLMDSDGDGYENFKEYIMGTNPIDRLSSFKLLLTGKSELTWSPVSDGRLYELQWTNSLTNPFQTIDEFHGSETHSIQIQNTDQDKGFYRIQIKMDE